MGSLTFGAGGKDPETGEVTKGWGYYEVRSSLQKASLTVRLSLVVRAPVMDGMERPVYSEFLPFEPTKTDTVSCHMTNTVRDSCSMASADMTAYHRP